MAERGTVPVSQRALVQRINRRLADDNEQLRRTREGTQAELTLGEYYILDATRGVVLHTHVDIEAVGRELNALQAWEQLSVD